MPLALRRLAAFGALLLANTALAQPERPIGFNRDVRPILSDSCFFCHGPDKKHRKAGLRLDERQAAIEDGALVPGKPEESELWKRITTGDKDDLMPPEDSHKTLTPAQLEVLRKWIVQGAPYEPHWAYTPVRRPKVPSGRAHPVDAFVGAELTQRRLQPSPPADPRTLLRRLSLDLIGLPPTPEETRAFLAEWEKNPGRAYERQIDRLLASPHFGERMAVPWLDVVRFADTVGYHGDQNQNIFPYRDYVIASFNRNKPFDRFTVEQLAGDLLPRPTTEQLVASGFNRLNMVTREGGAQPKEYLAKYLGDRVRAVGQVWMGSTLGCAECHDHKYDPISAKDFYALGAYFADIREWGVYNDYDYTPNPDLKGWSNDHPFPPEKMVKSPYLAERAARLRREQQIHLAAARARLDREAFEEWRAVVTKTLAKGDGWTVLAPRVVQAKPLEARIASDGVVTLVNGGAAKKPNDGLVKLEFAAPAGRVASLRLELPPRVEGASFRPFSHETTLRMTVRRLRAGEKPVDLRIHRAEATALRPSFTNGEEELGVERGWRLDPKHVRTLQVSVWELADPAQMQEGDALEVTLRNEHLAAARISVSPFATFGLNLPSPLPSAAGKLSPAFAQLKRGTRAALEEAFLLNGGAGEAERRELLERDREIQRCRNGLTPTLITVAQAPRTVRVLPRGNWQDDSGEIVTPATPHFLPALPTKARQTRLDLARWLTWRENPLTARTFVNRLWRQFFGAGLSGQLADLGAQGEPPTHPELLDWLAAEFMETGWDMKRLVKLLVTSETYRQDSTVRPELKELDPANRLLARQSQRRLEAELVRDNALFIAGLLDRRIGGPSVLPYQPDGYWENLEFPRRSYVAHHDDRQWRRGVYVHWQRTFLHPMMANFDAPSREECAADRPPSNTPQQALTLLNDVTFVEAARVFAARLLSQPGSDEARLSEAFTRAVGRPPRPAEATSLLGLLGEQREHYAAEPEAARKLVTVGFAPATVGVDPVEHAAWTSIARVILNVYEAVTRL